MFNLVKILAEDVRVFAYCEPDEIDEDFAVKQLERIAYHLQNADKDEITTFKRCVADLEKEAVKRGDNEASKQFKTMVKHLGLR